MCRTLAVPDFQWSHFWILAPGHGTHLLAGLVLANKPTEPWNCQGFTAGVRTSPADSDRATRHRFPSPEAPTDPWRAKSCSRCTDKQQGFYKPCKPTSGKQCISTPEFISYLNNFPLFHSDQIPLPDKQQLSLEKHWLLCWSWVGAFWPEEGNGCSFSPVLMV